MTALLRSARAVLGAALLVSPLVACDSITGTDNLSRAQDELDRNWNRFESSAPLSYSYTVHITCDCTTDITRPVIVYVDRGSVEYLYYEDNGRPVPQSVASSFPSAEQLFDAIQDGINQRADRIDVDYDFTYGYPTNVFIDYNRSQSGEELLMNTYGLRSWN
jgi:hypothetical protein